MILCGHGKQRELYNEQNDKRVKTERGEPGMGTEKKQPAFPQEALPNEAFSSHQTSSDKKTMAGLSNNMPPAKTAMEASAKGSADSVTQTPQTAEKQPPSSVQTKQASVLQKTPVVFLLALLCIVGQCISLYQIRI